MNPSPATPPPAEGLDDAQAAYVAHLVRARTTGDKVTEFGVVVGHTPTHPLAPPMRRTLRVVVELNLTENAHAALVNPPPRYYGTECPDLPHEHEPVDVVGAFDDELLMRCTPTGAEWTVDRPGRRDRVGE